MVFGAQLVMRTTDTGQPEGRFSSYRIATPQSIERLIRRESNFQRSFRREPYSSREFTTSLNGDDAALQQRPFVKPAMHKL